MNLTIKEINFTLLLLGIISTVACVVWCMYEYYLDQDFSLVDHKSYGESDDYIPPAISICFSDPFIERNIQKYDLNITSLDYKDFLIGKVWNEKMLGFEFENVTKNLDDYIVGYGVNGGYGGTTTAETFSDINSLKHPYKKPYLSLVNFNFGVLVKCYTLEIPPNVQGMFIKIRSDIFSSGVRPSLVGFSVMIHYPNQILTAFDSLRNDWPNRQHKPATSYFMIFKLKSVEVMKRRNSRINKCNEKWKTDDSDVFKQFVSGIQCKTPYHIWDTHYPYCNTKEKMGTANLDWSKRRQSIFKPPCQHVEKVLYEYQEYDEKDMNTAGIQFGTNSSGASDLESFLMLNSTNQTTFSINLALQGDKFKVIIHKKAYDLQTLIGNCGGYIGLILGTLVLDYSYRDVKCIYLILN